MNATAVEHESGALRVTASAFGGDTRTVYDLAGASPHLLSVSANAMQPEPAASATSPVVRQIAVDLGAVEERVRVVTPPQREGPRLEDAQTIVAGGRGLADAANFKLWRQQLRLRSGRFSSTFGLENDGSSNDILFMEQGLTSAFVLPRETGVLLHSESNRRRWDFSFSSSAKELECLICNIAGITGRYSTSFELGGEDRRLHGCFCNQLLAAGP